MEFSTERLKEGVEQIASVEPPQYVRQWLKRFNPIYYGSSC